MMVTILARRCAYGRPPPHIPFHRFDCLTAGTDRADATRLRRFVVRSTWRTFIES